MQYISEEQFELELPTSRAMLATTRPSCVYSLSACNAVYIVFVQPVDYWPVVGKFAETLELSYLDTRHRLWEEAETLSALAGLSVVSTTSSSQIDSIRYVLISLFIHYIVQGGSKNRPFFGSL